jgi:hypothetical protein
MLSVSRLVFAAPLLVVIGAAMHCGGLDPNASNAAADGSTCTPPDEDGYVGHGTTVFQLYVSDDAFYRGGDAGTSPVLTVQNLATVQLTLTNTGTKPHDFAIDCYPTPNTMGCPQQSCIDAASIPTVKPGTSATVTFMVPVRDNIIYTFRSNLPGDAQTGQLNVI